MRLGNKIAVGLLSLSAAGFASWQASEGFTSSPVIPTKGDVPTIGHGSTRYEDGTPVRMTDPPITRQRAAELARNLGSDQHRCLVRTLPGVELSQAEYDEYHDFVGQYGCGNWQKPKSPRTWLLLGDYKAACNALLNWRYVDGFDCSTPGNKTCRGVWTRQLERHAKCMAAQ